MPKAVPLTGIDALRLDPHNANKGTDRGRAMVAASLEECGAGRSILADKDGTVIAGNKTLEAARKLGLPVRVVETNGEELVVVRRTDLSIDEERGRRCYGLELDPRYAAVVLERMSGLGLEATLLEG